VIFFEHAGRYRYVQNLMPLRGRVIIDSFITICMGRAEIYEITFVKE